ncbi:MAG: long-chain fatty acid--CoA ligase [Aeromicrobium sp.]|uniref:AMP-dependent synthetase/ligase n=1 Tax=Aeromicrobium sp. TaxID=1871063 RepID=UPI0039E219FB
MSPLVPTPAQLEIVENRAPSIGRLFLDRVADTPNREAYRYPDANERWHSLSWSEVGERVGKIAAGLVALGLDAEDRAAVASGTRVEWILADLAVNVAGGATTTVYPTTVADDVAYILADSGSKVVFAEDDDQIAKLTAKKSELPEVVKVVTFDGAADGDWVISLADLEKVGEAHLKDHPDVVEERVAATSPESLATLIYTSGTTGRPKGVRLSHTGWVFEGVAVQAHGLLGIDDLEYRWLPMAHSFGKVLQMVQMQHGFPAAIDGRVTKIVDNLAVVKPTFMGAAPRIFEKAYGRIIGMMEEEGGVKLKLFRWAEKVGLEHSRLTREGKPVPKILAIKHGLADKVIFSKVRDRFGGRIRFFISGSAALSADVAEWFHSAGVVILEGYGLTETSAGSTINHPDHLKLGSVGFAFPGSEVKIAEDGEVLIKGPHVMHGYHNLDTATAETLDADGWLHTGDEGRIDADGFLFITGRKKELFKTSGGKYVAPPHIEGMFKGICPLASQMLVHGPGRNFVSALITLDPDAVALWAENHGQQGKSYTEIVTSPEMQKVVAEYVDQLNAKLNRWETIKKWAVLPDDLTVEAGDLTPSLKVKRKVVEDKHADLLDSFYS